jgi:hypothetical protein
MTRLGRRASREWTRTRVVVAGARASLNLEAALERVNESAVVAAKPPLVNCLIFSKNRAMQLDAFLRSIEAFAPYDGHVVVIYRATTPAFEEGYRQVKLGPNVTLTPESDSFKRDVSQAIDPSIALTVFHTDDDLFFRRPLGGPLVTESFAAFSLRLGLNTTYCYPLRRPQELSSYYRRGSLIAWNWTHADVDFSYPMSLDGHIFSTATISRIVSRCHFHNPNTLEEALHLKRYLVPHGMLSFVENCLVSVPANVVSDTHSNRSGKNSEVSVEALNRRFLAGERIDRSAMDFSAVNAAHSEIPLAFSSLGTSL